MVGARTEIPHTTFLCTTVAVETGSGRAATHGGCQRNGAYSRNHTMMRPGYGYETSRYYHRDTVTDYGCSMPWPGQALPAANRGPPRPGAASSAKPVRICDTIVFLGRENRTPSIAKCSALRYCLHAWLRPPRSPHRLYCRALALAVSSSLTFCNWKSIGIFDTREIQH